MLTDDEILTITNDGEFYRRFTNARPGTDRWYATHDAVLRARKNHPKIKFGNNARLNEAHSQLMAHYMDDHEHLFNPNEKTAVWNFLNSQRKQHQDATLEHLKKEIDEHLENAKTYLKKVEDALNPTTKDEIMDAPMKMFEEVAYLNGSKLLDMPPDEIYRTIANTEKRIAELEAIEHKPASLTATIAEKKQMLLDLVAYLDKQQ